MGPAAAAPVLMVPITASARAQQTLTTKSTHKTAVNSMPIGRSSISPPSTKLEPMGPARARPSNLRGEGRQGPRPGDITLNLTCAVTKRFGVHRAFACWIVLSANDRSS
jgi:hypothetical protein